jgi:Flp pilus assembly protein TadB
MPVPAKVSIERDGKTFIGEYTVTKGMLKVITSGGQKETQLGGTSADALARLLLAELVNGGKAWGDGRVMARRERETVGELRQREARQQRRVAEHDLYQASRYRHVAMVDGARGATWRVRWLLIAIAVALVVVVVLVVLQAAGVLWCEVWAGLPWLLAKHG